MTEYLSPKQAAQRTPFGTADWYRDQLKSGRLRGSKVGGRWFTTLEAIEEMVEAGSNLPTRRRRRRQMPPGC